MRLRRIEAVSYGALRDATLGDLDDGLTVVHGPNEAGKSTFISLVRHLLYGFPTARAAEPGYLPPDGKRIGRLVFEDAAGSWVVQRVEGTYGGDVTVRTLAGEQRPTLAKDIVHGVSGDAYRVVFGFGLDEMASVARASADDDILGRLYAASAGLRVSPQQVRAAVDAQAEALFKPTGRKRQLNVLAAELRAVRSETREIAREAEALIAEKGRAEALASELAAAREAREDARARLTALTLACERADERVADIAAQEEALLSLRRERKRLDDERGAIALDEELLAAATEIDAILADAVAVGAQAQALADAETSVVRARTRAADAAERTGLDPAVLAALGDPRELLAVAQDTREELGGLRSNADARTEAATRAAQALEQARGAAIGALEPLGIGLEGASEELGVRYDALDAIAASRSGRGAETARGSLVPALILLVTGALAVVGAVVLEEWLTVAIGAVVTAVGSWLAYRARYGAPALPAADDRTFLGVLGLDASAGPLDISRVRRALDAARAAVERMGAAASAADEAAHDAGLSAGTLASRQALWESWLAERGLDRSMTPSAAVSLLTLVGEARREAAALREAEADAQRIAERMDALAARLAEAARPYITVALVVTRDDVAPIASRLAERLAAVRDAAARREGLAREIAALDTSIAAEEARGARAARELTEILERCELSEGGSHLELRELAAQAERRAREAEDAFDAIAEARNQLEGQLERIGRERRADELRLAEAGLAERIAEMADRYLVLALASRLLAAAQERYGRERQPDVVRHAGRVFSTITEGRYVGLGVPLDGGPIEAFDTHSAMKRTAELSRGAAEQLYLALRIGLISRLGEVGDGLPVLMDDVLVNFDPARKRGAVDAIVELAQSRQVVFFTCHPETAELFGAAAPGHTRLELPRTPV